MHEQALDPMAPTHAAMAQEAAACVWQDLRPSQTVLEAGDELVFPKHKRVVTRYATDESGATELHLHYGVKEVVFDEPALFAFGEMLAGQARFVAGTATTWGNGYEWPRVRELLEQLIEEGILRRADEAQSETSSTQGACPSPLPAAQSTIARTWFECETIMRELTGRPLELGYLELVVPVYRVAHIALDAEGRQVGEANVFPSALRLEVPTEWRTCPYPGSRYQDALPMNVTALRSMNKYWKPMMVALLHIREAYLHRFPHARHGWTVGDLQRLSTLVLTVPAYLLMRPQHRVENGRLHPVLSSMFRVTDGVRMTLHRMLFTSTNEPPLPPEAPMTSAELYAYAERNGVFLSDSGVCAGSRVQIEEFLRVFIDGKAVEGAESVVLDAHVQAALAALDPAFDYGLYALQAYAAVFSLWPMMSQTYEHLLALVEEVSGETATFTALRESLQRSVRFLRTATRLQTAEQRGSHARVYADMYTQCTHGLGASSSGAALAACIAPVCAAHHADAAERLRTVLRRRCSGSAVADSPVLERMVAVLIDYLRQEQAIVQAASEIQQRINGLLGRTPPTRALTASDLALHYRLVTLEYRPEKLQDVGGRLPYLVDELEETLGLHIVVSNDAIDITDRAAV